MSPEMNPETSIVILGSGLAGYTLARELRKLDKSVPLTVVSADHGGFYSKPMLSNGFASGRTPESLVTSSAEAMAAQLGMTVMAQTRVLSIDTTAHQVHTDQGAIVYGKLVLALGADPIRLPIDGDAAEQILSVNDWEDYLRFRSRVATAERVLVMGAGLIGCEFANDLCLGGKQVALVDIADRPLGRLLPDQAASAVQQALQAAGVDWFLGASINRVDSGDGHLLVTLADGRQLTADLVLSAIGLRPRTSLAAEAGLVTGRGIEVDRFLRTSQPDVYALGDCAEVCGLVLPYVMPIMQAARVLAKTLVGEPTELSYPAMPVTVKTPAAPTVVAPPMDTRAGRWEETSDERGVVARFVGPDDQLLGFALVGPATADRMHMTKLLPAWL